MENSNLNNRRAVLAFLQSELEGPCAIGKPLIWTDDIHFDRPEDAHGPFCQEHNGEEILHDIPLRRYGVGVLYPIETDTDDVIAITSPLEAPETVTDDTDNADFREAIEDIIKEGSAAFDIDITDDEVVDSDRLRISNEMFQGCMGVSFLLRPSDDTSLVVEFTGGTYVPKVVHIAERDLTWWARQSIFRTATFDLSQFPGDKRAIVKPISVARNEAPDGLELSIEAISRPRRSDERLASSDERLVTIYVVNRTVGTPNINTRCVFQSRFCIRPLCSLVNSPIVPYPERKLVSNDAEVATFSLLYRSRPAFAVGHGCSADWDVTEQGRAMQIRVESLPKYEVPMITANAVDCSGRELNADMSRLAGLQDDDQVFVEVDRIVSEYVNWIATKRSQMSSLPLEYRSIAEDHMGQCEAWVERMQKGISYLHTVPKALDAFKLANHAMLLQQIQSAVKVRATRFDAEGSRLVVEGEFPKPDSLRPPGGRGYWRAFQIAFLLANICPIALDGDVDRDSVDLVWFPTGGGKTEAYLAVIAFALFHRRLTDPGDVGVHAIMRYTLRLLTTQQFQRASSLICALEYLRRQRAGELGDTPFRIGLWLGGETTPNSRKAAIMAYNELRSGKSRENPFLLLKCPWCSAKFGLVGQGDLSTHSRTARKHKQTNAIRLAGYTRDGDTVVFQCPDTRCDFHNGIPAVVIDEDVYDLRPDLVIATVDKFAVLPWKPEARSLFGIDNDGKRRVSPPGLIIQDELHLITGALGTLTGLFESLVEELCIDRRNHQVVKPKIICSTATIRNYRDQIRGLFARNTVVLFPSPGLDIGDSFFARYDMDSSGKPLPGKLYVGVHAPGLRSIQTAQVRTLTALLQAPMLLPETERDPWWTLVSFFNSLRELGTTLTLFQSDIPDYRRAMQKRFGIDKASLRRLVKPLELTSRLKSDEIPGIIAALETLYPSKEVVDVCLASSMIEVGIDIERLSLMLINGQPKSTAQYIQVTGRVGRKTPGLVITLYNFSRPRDRSHYERFRSYHERFYSEVEPSSVTPFSSPALHRFLHAVVLGYVRQCMEERRIVTPDPCPDDAIDQIKRVIQERALVAASAEEREILNEVFAKRIREWRMWKPLTWEGSNKAGNIPLMYSAGEHIDESWEDHTWAVPRSLRNVDATCQIELSCLYEQEDE